MKALQNNVRYIILVLILAVYAILSVFRPGGLIAYAFPSACWALLALATLWAGGFRTLQSWFNKRVSVMAVLIAAFQLIILINAGIFTSFGKSPLSFTPRGLALNLILVLSTLLGIELSRAYLIKNYGKKKPTLTLLLVTILYSLIITSITALPNLNEPLPLADFLGTGLLPALTENLLASYLALLSGPIASLAYRAPLQAFQWFSPILPDPPWGIKALLGVMTPTIGFIAMNMATTQKDLKKAGIPTQTKPFPRLRKSQTSMTGWTAISIFLVLTVWTSTGLLGFYPTIISSGSMRPTMEVGDIAIVIQTPPERIKQGDIIQFWHEREMVIHRVYNIYEAVDTKLFITKGDANPIPDDEPVFPAEIREKVIHIIPKVGWVSIHIKNTISTIWTFFSANTTLAYATLTITTLTASIYAIHAHKSRHRHWRRKGGWSRT